MVTRYLGNYEATMRSEKDCGVGEVEVKEESSRTEYDSESDSDQSFEEDTYTDSEISESNCSDCEFDIETKFKLDQTVKNSNQKHYQKHQNCHSIMSTRTTKPRSNSTSSLKTSSSLASPNISELNYSIALSIQSLLHLGHSSSYVTLCSLFSEHDHPLFPSLPNLSSVPSLSEILSTLSYIFIDDLLPPEICILTWAFVNRLVQSSGISIHASNYRRVMLAASIVACKLWEDNAIWNRDFVNVGLGVDIKDLCHLERGFLEMVKWEIEVTGTSYAQWYFELRDIRIAQQQKQKEKQWNIQFGTKKEQSTGEETLRFKKKNMNDEHGTRRRANTIELK